MVDAGVQLVQLMKGTCSLTMDTVLCLTTDTTTPFAFRRQEWWSKVLIMRRRPNLRTFFCSFLQVEFRLSYWDYLWFLLQRGFVFSLQWFTHMDLTVLLHQVGFSTLCIEQHAYYC